MAKKFKVAKENCISCGTCIAVCPKGAAWDEDGKAKIIDSAQIEKCGGKTICPYEAIKEVKEKGD